MPPPRVWFVFLGALLTSFCNGMATALTQAMSNGNALHRYAWMAAICLAVVAGVAAAKLAWPTEPPRSP